MSQRLQKKCKPHSDLLQIHHRFIYQCVPKLSCLPSFRDDVPMSSCTSQKRISDSVAPQFDIGSCSVLYRWRAVENDVDEATPIMIVSRNILAFPSGGECYS